MLSPTVSPSPPENLMTPAREFDAATLARSVVDNYGAAKLNAQQLNDLIAVTRKLHAK
jgi:hypothetical protein